ncbi:MAG: oligosaccharide repeat unit polymerase [Candidatus Competibacteraceae bacterium]|nr:oligosaccharide repeat unit polymerase [Candidatus Competibacteraceae bacterium]
MYEQFGGTINLVILFIILVMNTYSIWLLGYGKSINPIFYFIIFFSLQATGTLPPLDLDMESDWVHACILALASFVILLYIIFFYQRLYIVRLVKKWQASPECYMTKLQIQKIILLMSTSIVISLIYYKLVGYNLFLVALKGGSEDFISMRLAAYSGEIYTGAGVVNQFKNTILPITFLALLLYTHQIRRPFIFTIFFFTLTPIFLYCIMGTGQRSYLFFSLVMLIIYYLNTKKINKMLLAIFVSGFIFIFGIYSVMLGRQEESSLFAIIGQLYHRIFVAQQMGALVGFNYIYGQDIQMGYEWWESFRGLIPGLPGSDLSHRIHALIFGSTRGTAPISLWVSMYHNFGILGVTIGTFILMALLQRAFKFILQFERNTINSMSSAALILYCGLLVFGSPFQIINNGFIGLILLYFTIRPKRLNRHAIVLAGSSSI